MYVLDTDSCIYLLNQKVPSVEARLREIQRGDIGISALTAAELHYGAAHSKNREENRKKADIFCSSLTLFPFDLKSAQIFGDTKEYLMSRGEMIGILDLLIASCALSLEAILVTHNSQEFRRIPELKLEDWFRD